MARAMALHGGMMLLGLAVACEPRRTEDAVVVTPAQPTTSASVAPSTASAGAAPSAHAAPSSSTPAAPPLEMGEGACLADSDCVVSSALDAASVGVHACCSYICPPGRVVSAKIERTLASRHDAACAKPHKCPPPAPCRKNGKRLTPRCVDGQCAGEVHIAPVPADPGM